MIGRWTRGSLPLRHNYHGKSKKKDSTTPQWGGSGLNFLPPNPGKKVISPNPLQQSSPTTTANYPRVFNGGINEEVCCNNGIQSSICLLVVILYTQLFLNRLKNSERDTGKNRKNKGRKSNRLLCSTGLIIPWETYQVQQQMAGDGVDDLVVHLEKSMDLSTVEQGIKLVGTALVSKTLNKWGVRNILKSA
ncbi:hypothetical protein TB1_014846 [Malus domestica]